MKHFLATHRDWTCLPFILGLLMSCVQESNEKSRLLVSPSDIPKSKAPMVVRKTKAVAYKIVKNSKPLERINLTTAGGNLSIVVRPQDFQKAEIACSDDQCTAVLYEPVVVQATIPTPLNVKVKITYKQTRKPEDALFSHHLSIGGQWNLVDVGDILNIAAELGFSMEAKPDDGFKPKITKIICSKSISCETPLFVISGSIDQRGIQFANRLVVSDHWTSSDKIVLDQIQQKTSFSYKDITQADWFQKLPLPPCLKRSDYDALWIPDDKDSSESFH